MSENGHQPEPADAWIEAPVGDVLSFEYGKGLPAKNRRPGQVKVFASAGEVGAHDESLVDEAVIVVGRKGAAGNVFIGDGPAWVIDTAYYAVAPPEHDIRFLAYQLSARGLERLDQSTAIPSLSREDLRRVRLILPPLDEQRRLVRRIEHLLSEIGTGLEAASRARIGAARLLRATAEEEVGRLAEQGCQQVSAEELSADVPYALAIGPFGSNLKVSDYANSGVPLVFVRNIRAGEFGATRAKFVSQEKADELRAHRVQGGDILVTKMGDPPGDCAIYPLNAPDAIVTSDCIRFAVDPALARTDYVAALFLTAKVKKQIRDRTKGVAQRKVSLKTFKTIQFPLPDLKRQDAIVARLNDVREAQGALGQTLRATEDQGSRLERSVFSAVFHKMLKVSEKEGRVPVTDAP